MNTETLSERSVKKPEKGVNVIATELFTITKAIINEWDPAQLLAFDCPEDEYHSEIRAICNYINITDQTKILESELGLSIYKIFKDQLGIGFQKTQQECTEISSRIIMNMKKV